MTDIPWRRTVYRRTHTLSPRVWLGFLIAALAATWITQVSAQQVGIEKTGFQNVPDKFFYFKDSSVVLWLDVNSHTVWRSDNHGNRWDKVTDVPENQATFLYEHPFDTDKAYVLGKGKTHWKTTDKGRTWQRFDTPVEPGAGAQHLSFHAERANYMLFTGFKCNLGGWTGLDCRSETYYTLNNFEELTLLRTHTTACIWTRSNAKFQNAPTKEVMCVESPKKSGLTGLLDPESLRLVQSEDFFHTEQPVNFSTGDDVRGVIAVTTVNQFLVAAVKPSPMKPDMDLYVSLDGENWHEAVFPVDATVHEKAYTIVQSTSTSILVDVLDSSANFGTLYKSNSNGTFFVKSLEYTNRNAMGIVDFERVQGVEGIMVANVVVNHEQVERGNAKKEIQTRMSFDDGATWNGIKNVKNSEGRDMPCSDHECTLHMHSVTTPHNNGQVFSSNTAVGVMMGVGNFGRNLLEYDECDTFLSVDGGLSWKMVREGAHKYEFGDMGSVLVLVDDEKFTDHIWWSKDRGNNWQKLDLGVSIRARMLTTDPESTSRNFLIVGGTARSSDSNVQAIHLDFTKVHPRQCQMVENDDSRSDFEKWFARDLTPGPDCLMGHEQMFYRRKTTSDCYIGRDFQDPVVEMKNCPCLEADYECDYNFQRDANGRCVRIGPDGLTNDQCKSKDDVYLGSSGYRLIAGNTCDREAGKKLDEPISRKCSENTGGSSNSLQPTGPTTTAAQPSEDNISKYQTVFNSEIDQFTYFRDSPAMLLRLQNGELWHSTEHGIQWKRVLENEGKVRSYVLHEFDNARAYALLEDGIQVTENYGETWTRINVPAAPSKRAVQVLDFHPQEKDWLLFIGDPSPMRHAEAYISKDHGRNWDSMKMTVDKCIFGRDSNYNIEKETIYCSTRDEKLVDNELKLVRTLDWGKSKETLFDKVVEFFVIEDFMAVASNNKGDLALYVSINGKTFAEAQFPPNQYIDRNTFTVLQSTTHSILLNIFKSVGFGKAYGTLYKSNENGTFYHQSLADTNGDARGFVDFEKMQSIDGIILANQVTNAYDLAGGRDTTKKVRTMISWDDGGHWEPLKPPHAFDCSGKDCTLNLHSRTDIHGPGAIFTASGAPGLAMGVGNVGPSLLPYEQSNTFLTRDGGHSWEQIQEGEHLYEFGDQGSLLALINDEGPTNELLYSWDQGVTWHYYRFSETLIRVSALTTDPKSSTLKFVIIGHTRDRQRSPVFITVDFSTTKTRQCDMDKKYADKSDFERWIPKDDDGDDACLLGKKAAYWRRKKDRVCIVGNRFKEPEMVRENCECRDTDFECDFGFWQNDKGECVVYGRHPDRPINCKPKDKFRGRSGYKKISKSTCIGGLDLAKEKEWDCGVGGDVQSSRTEFTDRVVDYVYFTDTDRVFVRTADGKVWRSDNDGHEWHQQFKGSDIIAIYQNPHFEQRAYFITNGLVHYVTNDKGTNFEEIHAPLAPVTNIQGTVLSFHKDEQDYLLYLGEAHCESFLAPDCQSQAFYSQDNGRSWHLIGKYIRSCIWGRDGSIDKADHDAIFCEEYRDKSGNQRSFYSNPVQFVSSSNYFVDKKNLFDDIVGVALFGKYMVVAVSKNRGTNLLLQISLDGETFAPASFPASFDLKPEAFTIMESVNSLWIHVSTNTHRGSEFGTIFTSNSNGTYYVSSLENTNRNEMGIVDFEKMQGIEGVAIANTVSNPNQANMGDPKKLVTVKTVDAGGRWTPLSPPDIDSTGKKFDCKGNDCNLHLHCYSERRNTRDLFSLSSAVGLMVGVGNVGPSLSGYRDGDMFLTRDAGKSWLEVLKGAHLWEFADQGALLMMVDDEEPTNVVKYTTNEGLSWGTYEFAKKNEKIKVDDIITQPDGTSQKYVIFGTERQSGKTVAYHIDFSAIHPTQCKLDIKNQDDDDFELWSPEDTRGEKCLFGRETLYYRRIRDRDCYIGEKLIQPREEVRNCQCTEADFECDFNYVRDKNNKCVLVPGLEPLVPTCDGSIDFYYESTGYRKIAASTCVDGLELDKGDQRWCSGKSGSGAMWVLYLFAPVIGAGLVFVCLRYRNQVAFGRIRLPDGGTRETWNIPPILTKMAAISVIIPVGILALLSRIPRPQSWSDLNVFRNFHMPTFRRGGPRYSPLGQDEHTDVLLDDYDGSEEHLIDEADEEDADEL
ncbi:vacuolar protein sorting/targeting protein PEP1 [Apophysomyces sp. BC1034]|nr:vacuolar protein sorting/targeting protein PEP1 [Apophysomyces sp. BC1015]KAG0182510.1 vacuolar protein sorting/targeting protein PEP1 [Apophysomyces sp. BC1021]KAG0194086.1 vacuolar protein sorting/targeting protein PEP1 [Apophysomyces sp. BC1034]